PLLHTTPIKLPTKSQTTSHTYQHQPLLHQLHQLIPNTHLNKLSYQNLHPFQKPDILPPHYIPKSPIPTKNFDQITKA
ncbi:complement inhibitor SCIN family protein, partial [Staphylococcus aureus]|uniref:complement inhibitor SCIN family protein n=1 Tax=Staphylococcus aureus TaxID=1280 RepID=UPI0011A112EC